MVSFAGRPAAALEDGGRHVAGRLSRQPDDWISAVAATEETAAGVEPILRIDLDRGLPHLARDAETDALVQTLVESKAGKEFPAIFGWKQFFTKVNPNGILSLSPELCGMRYLGSTFQTFPQP